MNVSLHDLRKVVMFEDASDDDLNVILQNSITRTIEEGGFFFFQGDPAEYFYVLTRGQVKLLQSNPSGQQVNLRTIQPWEMFGALGALRANATYPANAQALEDSASLAIQSEFMHSLMEKNPHLSLGLAKVMTSYIQEIQVRYRELSTERVERRIAHTILRLASQAGSKKREGSMIELAYSRQDLAEMTGATLYTVSRVLSKWDTLGIIEAGRERIRIKNPHKLVEISEGTA